MNSTETILAQYAALKSLSRKEVQQTLRGQSRVASLSDDSKAGMINSILVNRHGSRRVTEAFAK